MASSMANAALSVVGTALAPLKDILLEKWAASKDLGANVKALKLELLSVKALLEHTRGREVADNSGLKELLVMLQDHAYDADDVLDELEYFRIQDVLKNSSDAADEHAEGDLALHLRHTAKNVAKQIWLPACLSGASSARQQRGRKAKLTSTSCCCNTSHAVGKCLPCSSPPCVLDNDSDGASMHSSPERNNHTNQPSEQLNFDRVEASQRMQHIAEELRHLREIVFATITALGPNGNTFPNIDLSRTSTICETTQKKLFGRDSVMKSIIDDITKQSDKVLKVIPIVGSGGMGKTTLAQHIYNSEKVTTHFGVKVWTCVSFHFNVNELMEKIQKDIPKVDGEKEGGNAVELIGERLKNKRFLLILDDVWDCSNEDEWEKLLVPFKKSQVLGNIIIVTTRIREQARIVKTVDCSIELDGLKAEEIMDLFLQIIFGDDQSIRNSHPDLIKIAYEIIQKLKGSPLAAKTVGRLLKPRLDEKHWKRVLESKEWERQKGDDDIMPALKLSYHYLPSQLQRCFSYCALFPQDYEFQEEELINLWIGLDVLHSSHDENKSVEEIGESHLVQLVDHGFFEKKERKFGGYCYILHDLLHDLARNISSHECLSIKSSEVRSLKIPPSIRHLSINIDDTSVENRLSIKNCVDDLNTLQKRLKVEKLRSLMLFGYHLGCFLKPFRALFKEAKALRVVFLSQASYDVEDLLHNFYNLVHLRYLRIHYHTRFPNKISRFYHMMVVDANHCGDIDLPRDMGNLIKLRHFLVQKNFMTPMLTFTVKEKDDGFELRQVGRLVELCGSLCITSLEQVQAKEEASEAKLTEKSQLQELILCWDGHRSANDSTHEQDVLERLKPSRNLQKLSIRGHKGANCPSWLGMDLSVKSLESLCLEGVAWETFPPIGEWSVINGAKMEISRNIPDKKFEKLKRLELVNLPRVKKWVVDAPCRLFPHLEELIIRDCSNFVELLFSHLPCCQQETPANLFPKLSHLVIENCPELSSFPPVPWTKDPHSFNIKSIGGSGCFVFGKNYNSLSITGTDTPHSNFWDLLPFYNLTGVEKMKIERCQPLPLHQLRLLSSLKNLWISCSSIAFPLVEGDSQVGYKIPVEKLYFEEWSANGEDLTRLLSCFPKLSSLEFRDCHKITGLGVMGKQATTATPGPSSSANKVDEAQIEQHQQQQDAEGLLLLPPQLQELDIFKCEELSLRFNKEDGRTGAGAGGGLHGLTSLRKLSIKSCPKFLSSYSSSCFPFPNSLEDLYLLDVQGPEMPVPLSNLTSLTSLRVWYCKDLRGEGLLSLLTQGNLTRLSSYFFAGSEPVQELTSRPSKLKELSMDDLLFAESFTEEQGDLLFADSLEEIRFEFIHSMQHLPARLHKLPNLKRLIIRCCKSIKVQSKDDLPSSLQELEIEYLPQIQSLPDGCLPSSLQKLVINNCPAIRSLPKDGLPSSLKWLEIKECPEICSLPKNCLPSSLQKLSIKMCPAILALPEVDDLPSSLRELYVSDGSEELMSKCSKLNGIIPIVIVKRRFRRSYF